MLDDLSREFEMLVYEIKLLKDVLYQKEIKLQEACQHRKIKRGKDSLYYCNSFDADVCGIDGYTYECLICNQKWKFQKPYEKFDKIVDATGDK